MPCLAGTQAGSPYAAEIEATLPRLLALSDRNPLSPTCGQGDRQHWAWKLIDFPNATLQGPVNGLATLITAKLLSVELDVRSLLGRITDTAQATRAMMRKDGSLEEAFPFERSFCVTALIAFDFLHAADDLGSAGFAREAALLHEAAGPFISFVVKSDENHGFIANHLATAAAALARWHRAAGDQSARTKCEALLARILGRQSDEGWFPEYDGADPGYQTLCMSHLADVASVAPAPQLDRALARGARFLTHFAHPDGSFGGLYGSRATRVYYPAGIEMMAATNQDAAALARFMRRAIARHATVPLSSIDAPNLSPLFNNYCTALRESTARGEAAERLPADELARLPALAATSIRLSFPQAGLLIDGSAEHYSIVSTHKGGVTAHWRKGQRATVDAGVALADAQQRVYTSQTFDPKNTVSIDEQSGILTVVAELRKLELPQTGPLSFALMRLLAITVLRVPTLGDLFKKMLVKLLITARRRSVGRLTRTIRLGPAMRIEDRIETKAALKRIDVSRPFSVIHMASQGYWQRQDDAGGDP